MENNNNFMLKSFPKILTIFFLAVFIFQLACLIFLFALPQAGQAADPAKFTPQVGIGTDFQAGTSYVPDGSTAMIGQYIRAIYKYAIGIVGILAAVVLMIGGVMWIVAGGSSTMIGEAKSWIGASLTGLVLALMSYLILATINPALVDLKTTEIKKVTSPTQTSLDASAPLSGNGTNCCDGNNDTQCSSGYICNMYMTTSACMGRGVCAVKQNLNGQCGENNDCVSNNCDAGTLATHRCQ